MMRANDNAAAEERQSGQANRRASKARRLGKTSD